MDLIQSRFVCPLLFPFYCVIELNRGKKNQDILLQNFEWFSKYSFGRKQDIVFQFH